MSLSKTSDHIQIKIKMPTPHQEPPASSKSANEVLKDMDVLCTFKIKIESWNSEYKCIKNQWPVQIKIKMQNPSQEHPASSKAPNDDLKGNNVLCTFKVNTESQNLDQIFS